MYYLASVPAPPAVAAIAEAAAIAAAQESPMKKHLKWKLQQTAGGTPCMASLTLPTVTADDDIYMDPRLAMSPNLPGSAAGFMVPGLVNPMAAAAAFGLAACNPGFVFERLGPHILRSHISTAQHKSIPHNDDVDLEAFRRKDPREWNMDDVIGWMISVAKTRGIPIEDMNMHRFSNCTGPLLTLMSQQNFIDRDGNYGALLYSEFRKLMGDERSTFLDEWMRLHKDEITAGTSSVASLTNSTPIAQQSPLNMVAEAAFVASLYGRATPLTLEQPCTSSQSEVDDVFGRPGSYNLRESVIKAAGSGIVEASSAFATGTNALGSLPDLRKLHGIEPKPGLDEKQHNNNIYLKTEDRSSSFKVAASSVSSIPKLLDGKIKKKVADGCSLTLSGKPRKRSQHTRGNKLWEFIRSALRDPKTCPSLVKWEDEREGVFRIVESEKLARLWGEKKNNHKMTYEKLSRAMRTYYEKQILVPVPKTGLYPKKLVYKFGKSVWPDTGAKTWQQTSVTAPPATQSSTFPTRLGAGKTTKNQLSKVLFANDSSTAPAFGFHGNGISSFGITTKIEQAEETCSSNFLSKMNSDAVVAAANGLMSLADAANRHMTMGGVNGTDNHVAVGLIDNDRCAVSVDVITVTKEDFKAGEDESEDTMDIDSGEADRDTPPPLLC